jgi:REP element-mobilizing transposase RayT
MPQTHINLIFHIIFGTKERRPLIDNGFKEQLFKYITGIIANYGGKTIVVNGTADHIHILVSLGADKALSEIVRAIKANSSKFIHEEFPSQLFQWQDGYAAFTVSHSQADSVIKYISGQEEHHRQISFEDEFAAFIKKHGIETDPRYIWS